ncbi:MAG TPA: TetR/AcrR family transcriptional regulator [Microthrixaceae bacterium]|nr:TetR/AcrR family transcriptional regulator [Microthrixaceae bacterium]
MGVDSFVRYCQHQAVLTATASPTETRPTRREPFADRPGVGPRGLRTHQRILDGALDAFGESGYHRTSLDRVAELAGCSRVAIYQYVSGKDELFRLLASQASNQMWAALESMSDVTPDADGHASLRAYISRLADIEVRYEPIIRAFEAAAEDDDSLAGGAASIVRRGVGLLQARIVGCDLPPRLLGPAVELLNTGVISALSRMSILRAAAPEHYGRERVDLALADFMHRALFGPLPDVNIHSAPQGPGPPVLELGVEAERIFRRAGDLEAEAASGKRALQAMLGVANDLIADRGYRGLRIDDIVRAAGVSRGSFYTYFDDIEDFVRVMGVRAIQDVSTVVTDLPEVPTRAALRRWLQHFAAVNLTSGPLVRVWIEAIEGPLRDDRAAVIDWGRRQLASMLRAREIGDVEVSAEILLAVVEVFGTKARTKAELDAVLTVIERGLVSPAPAGHGRSRR